MKITQIFSLTVILFLSFLTSCLSNSSDRDYSAWRQQNEEYIKGLETETVDGHLKYEKIIPDWDPNVYTLMCWHNDREENSNLLTPLSNSTVTLNYTLTNVEGDTIDMAGSFQCVPNNMVTGFWVAVTNMNENDTVTAVVPYNAGYGVIGSGGVMPYSTLIFGIRLKKINKLF